MTVARTVEASCEAGRFGVGGNDVGASTHPCRRLKGAVI